MDGNKPLIVIQMVQESLILTEIVFIPLIVVGRDSVTVAQTESEKVVDGGSIKIAIRHAKVRHAKVVSSVLLGGGSVKG